MNTYQLAQILNNNGTTVGTFWTIVLSLMTLTMLVYMVVVIILVNKN